MKFTVIYIKDAETEQLTAYMPDFPHVFADGDTEAEALSNLKETMALLNEARQEMEERTVAENTPSNITVGSVEMELV